MATTTGERIRVLREKRGLSQRVLAGMIGSDFRQRVQALERAKHPPRLDTLQRVADALGVPVTDLFPVP